MSYDLIDVGLVLERMLAISSRRKCRLREAAMRRTNIYVLGVFGINVHKALYYYLYIIDADAA